ncbi:MAG: histidine phosphatase family protein [Alphaproteobacteria bacterium]|nr:MAG: histidine phosphatase family protein [Alphaproteobacteria bacterium]
MGKKGTLVLFRHGETDHNAKHLMTGWLDVPLNAEGVAQAREAGRAVSMFHFDKVYCSTLSRTFNTAALALEAAGSQGHLRLKDKWNIEARDELKGANMGAFTGRNFKTDPEILNFGRRYDRRLPGGESDKDIADRVQKFFDAEILPRLKSGETVLVSTHSGTMRAFDVVLGFVPPPDPADDQWTDKTRIDNALPVVAEYEDGKLKRHYSLERPKMAAVRGLKAA